MTLCTEPHQPRLLLRDSISSGGDASRFLKRHKPPQSLACDNFWQGDCQYRLVVCQDALTTGALLLLPPKRILLLKNTRQLFTHQAVRRDKQI